MTATPISRKAHNMAPLSLEAQFVTFSLGEEIFAVPVEVVREILDLCGGLQDSERSGLPAGLRDVRGQGVPTIDLRLKLGMTKTVPTPHTRVLVLDMPMEDRVLTLGLVADRVFEVTPFRHEQIEAAPDIGVRWRSDYISGVVRRGAASSSSSISRGCCRARMPRPCNRRPERPTRGERSMSMAAVETQMVGDRISKRNFEKLAQFIYDYSGIKMPSTKLTMLEAGFAAGLRATQPYDVRRLLRFLFEEDGLDQETVYLIDAVTTNKTDFFRETTTALRIHASLRAKLSLARLNLMDESYNVGDPFDMIMCRNVMIYFDKQTQAKVLGRLCDRLKRGGYLFIGHSESITGIELPLVTVANTVFRKT
jgi:purine-binding chemotaxis protein CheW